MICLIILYCTCYVSYYKNSDSKKRPIRFLMSLPSYVFLLTCLRMAYVQNETCSIHVRAINLIKINL
jgi:hypothetical protein